jgi:membrane protease YdiL (CAAX protease family)
MLIGAAAVCGLFWGLLYQWRKNIFTVIVSHAVWDVVVMVLFPIS